MSARQRVAVIVTALVVGLALAGAAHLTSSYVDHRRETDRHLASLAADNRRNGDILVDCTTPTPPATPEDPKPRVHECYERGQRGQSGAIVELDCRARRMQARLPAPPDPRRPCTEQTPVDVYPGVAGQPPR